MKKVIDTSDLQFVRAAYNFEDFDHESKEDVYNDLLEKLTSIYGEPIASKNMWPGTYWHSGLFPI